MTYTSYPFDNQDTSESQYSALFSELQDSGVVDIPGGPGLFVTANASAMSVTLAPGSAVVRGHFFNNDATATLAIGAAGAAVRYDAVILRLDPTANSIVPIVVANAGQTPALTQTATGVYEILLAVVTVNTSATTISAANVADMRPYVGARVRVSPSTNRPTDVRNWDLNIATDRGGRIEIKDPTAGWVSRTSVYWGSGTAAPTSGMLAGDTYTHTTWGPLEYTGSAWKGPLLQIANFGARPTTGLYNGMRIQPLDHPTVTMVYSTVTPQKVSGATGIWIQEGTPTNLQIGGVVPDGAGLFRVEASSVPSVGGSGGQVVCSTSLVFSAKILMAGALPGDNAGSVGYLITFPAGNSSTVASFLAYMPSGSPVPNGTSVRVNHWAYGYIL